MNAKNPTRARRPAALAAAALALLLCSPAARAQDDDTVSGTDGAYSYLRTLDGSATLTQGDTGDRDAAQINQPVLAGDRLATGHGARAEVVLSDGSLVRLDGDSEALFDQLAGAPDSTATVTVLRLAFGTVQLIVGAGGGYALPRLETGNATVQLRDAGSYRITAGGADWSEVVVRSGEAEVVTDRGSLVVHPGEEAVVEGASWPRAELRRADAGDALERWGEQLDERLALLSQQVPYVDAPLRSQAAPLAEYGSWVEVGGDRAWRPAVNADWRPYWQGRWESTPAGLIWVSDEPWGWVPYHYGTWDYAPGYGWVWYPGSRFATAWVYWYWGPSYTAWVPVGYYTRHYGSRYGSGFRFGVYGWAGGDWNFYADWVFCPSGYFGSRLQPRYLRDGRDWHRQYGFAEVPRGVITTDTRGITPARWHKPQEVMTVLRTRPGSSRGESELPDVTPFVARRDDLPQTVRRRVLADPADNRKLAGTPLLPPSLAKGGVRTDGGGVVRSTRPTAVVVEPRGGETTPKVEGRPTAIRKVDVAPTVERPRTVRSEVPTTVEGKREVQPTDRTSTRPLVVRPRVDGETPTRVWTREPSPATGDRKLSQPAPTAAPRRIEVAPPTQVRPQVVRPTAPIVEREPVVKRSVPSGVTRVAPAPPRVKPSESTARSAPTPRVTVEPAKPSTAGSSAGSQGSSNSKSTVKSNDKSKDKSKDKPPARRTHPKPSDGGGKG
jgi:Family of unknown function (DUF6600)/FecR protein